MVLRIRSITRTSTVTGLLELVDEGFINLNDPLSKYFSYFHHSNTNSIVFGDIIEMVAEGKRREESSFPYETESIKIDRRKSIKK